MKKLVLCIILSGLCLTNSYASDSDYINWLRQELNTRNAAILKMQNTISRQDQTIRILKGNLFKLGTTFNVVLDVLYEDNLKLLDAQKTSCDVLTTKQQEEQKVKVVCTELDSLLGEPLDAPTAKEVAALYLDAQMKKVALNFKEALVDFQELITKHNNSALTPYAYYEMGDIYYRMGVIGSKNYAKAKENFLSFLSVTKFKDSHMWLLRANSFYRLGQILEKKDPGRAKKYFSLAVLQYQQDTSAIKIREIETLALIAETKLKILEINKYSSGLDVL